MLRLAKDDYGDRSGMIEDPFGHVWMIQAHIEDMSPAQMKRRMAELDPALSVDPTMSRWSRFRPQFQKPCRLRRKDLSALGWKRLIGERPLVRSAGSILKRAERCLANGDSVAVVTDITVNADPGARAVEWLTMTRRQS